MGDPEGAGRERGPQPVPLNIDSAVSFAHRRGGRRASLGRQLFAL